MQRIRRHRTTVRTETLAARRIQFAPRTFPSRDTRDPKICKIAYSLAGGKQKLPNMDTAIHPVSIM